MFAFSAARLLVWLVYTHPLPSEERGRMQAVIGTIKTTKNIPNHKQASNSALLSRWVFLNFACYWLLFFVISDDKWNKHVALINDIEVGGLKTLDIQSITLAQKVIALK